MDPSGKSMLGLLISFGKQGVFYGLESTFMVFYGFIRFWIFWVFFGARQIQGFTT